MPWNAASSVPLYHPHHPLLTRAGEIIHACENPQVLQRLAAAGGERPVARMSGNPAAAGTALLGRTVVLGLSGRAEAMPWDGGCARP